MVKIPANNQEYDSLIKLSSRAFGNAMMHVTGEKPGIVEVLHQDVLSARLKRGILDLLIKTSHGYCIDYEFHSGPINEATVLRNYQYAIDLRVEQELPVKPHFVSLDANKTPIPTVELFPDVYTNPDITFLADIDGKKVLNTIDDKLNSNLELDNYDSYYLALTPFFRNEKTPKEMLKDMSQYVNEIQISEELKYHVKLVQILSARALTSDIEQKELLGVIKMGSSYIDNYERNLIENAQRSVALRMKADGVSSDFIFKYFGFKL